MALRRLAALDAAEVVTDLLTPPSNRLEALTGDRQGQSTRFMSPANRIRAIVAGKRSITGETALRLARYFGTTPGYWMNLQAR